MADKEENKPLKYVNRPKDLGYMNKFNWKDEELQKWVKKAVQLQNTHVADNSMTKFFQYKQSELDALQLRICMLLFGFRLPPSAENKKGCPKGTPKCQLKCYSWQERWRARKLQVKISKDSKEDKPVHVNVIYVSMAFPDGKGSFNVTENPVFVFNESRKFMDTGGRVYIDWNDYLRNNNLPQGAMIFPENGTYTPEDDNHNPKNKVQLVAQETHSCKPSAVIKKYVDVAVNVTGVVLVGASLIAAAPLGAFAGFAAVQAAIATGSFYAGLICTTYSVATGGWDKITHDESVATEIMLVATMAFSSVAGRLTSSWTRHMASNVNNKWADVAKGISRTQQWLFTTMKLLQLASSSISVLSAIYHMWMKPNRTWLDYFQLSVSLFFFINVVTQPITLHGIFEGERRTFEKLGKVLRNQFRPKLHTQEAIDKFDETVKNAKTSDQRTYLIRNLVEIRNLDDYFVRLHQFGTHIEYTENGLIIDDMLEISPKMYNQIGNEQLKMKLNDIRKYPDPEKRAEMARKLAKDFNCSEETTELFKKAVTSEITNDEWNMLGDQMSKSRKDQLFGDIANNKNVPNYRENMARVERKMNNGKTVDEWKVEKTTLGEQLEKGKVTQHQYNEKIGEIDERIKNGEKVREMRKQFDNFVRQKISLDEVREDYVESQVKSLANQGIKSAERWKADRDKLEKQHAWYKSNRGRAIDNVGQEGYDRFMETYKTNIENMINAENTAPSRKQFENDLKKFNDQIDSDGFLQKNEQLNLKMGNYYSNERLMMRVHEDNLKTDVEQIWGVHNYENAKVNGKQIFKDMKINEIDRMSRKLNELGLNRDDIVNVARKLAEDRKCKLNGDNPNDFANLLEAVDLSYAQQIKAAKAANVPLDQDALVKNALENINHWVNDVKPFYSQLDGRMEFGSLSSAVVHVWKHKHEFYTADGSEPSIKQYMDELKNVMINSENVPINSKNVPIKSDNMVIRHENATGWVYSQDGKAIRVNYGRTDRNLNRYYLGVTVTNVQSQQTRVVTMHNRYQIPATTQPSGANNTMKDFNNNQSQWLESMSFNWPSEFDMKPPPPSVQ